MPINASDVKLYESQRLTDEDDGGGAATGREVIDGQINNLFPDISRIDRTIGDVALRKGFVGVATDNADVYLGAHVILTKPPADDNVHVLLFESESEADERSAARNRIESYVVKASVANWELLGNQLLGQRQLLAVQRLELDVPAVGDVFCLVDGSAEQYVRLTNVESREETFTYQSGTGNYVDFVRRRLVLGISAKLERTFPGGQPTPAGTSTPKASVLTTQVADASKYYGVTRLAQAAGVGDVRFRVASIYSNLVPSAQTEQALLDIAGAMTRRVVLPAATATISRAFTLRVLGAGNYRGYLPRPPVPGTVQLTLNGAIFSDDGGGVLTRASGALAIPRLLIDYETGEVSGTEGTAIGAISGTAVFQPGAAHTGRALSDGVAVTLANRGYNWTFNLAEAKPRPGTLRISYMALGKWYDVTDNGSGQLVGFGTGTVNYATGSAAVTLDSLPDADTTLLHTWVPDIADETTVRTGTANIAPPEFTLQLDPGVEPGSLTVTYTAGGVTRTATDDYGVLQGDATGAIDYAAGVVRLRPTALPDASTSIEVDYDQATPDIETVNPVPDSNGVVSGTIEGAPLLPGSVSLTFVAGSLYLGELRLRQVTIRDNGSGGWLGYSGSINYTTGDWSVTALAAYVHTIVRGRLLNDAPAVQTQTENRRETLESGIDIRYQVSGAGFADRTGSFSQTEVGIDLITNTTDSLLPGSLLFRWAGETYIDRDGILYRNPSTETGAATAVGEVNYTDRRVVLTTWPAGAGATVAIDAALTVRAAVQISRLTFRTPSAPLRPASLQVTATDAQGNLITAQADGAGVLSHARLSGTVNVETGVADLWFTTDDEDDTGASDVFVWPSTVRYNAVLYSFLPLDARLIGLDPVRLPADGRVPIFRPGDVAVLAHTTETDAGTPTAGQVVNLARDHQAAIEVRDANGVALDPAQYTTNRTDGRVTFANPLTLQDAEENALTTPLAIFDRVEHMSVVNDVQINGDLTIIGPLSQEFPANETVVSSALVFGDLNAREHHFFTQRSWNSGAPNWTDQRIGDDTTAKYNTVDFPLQVSNRGAITEKWALVFTGTNTFQIVGQRLGIIGTGTTGTLTAPNNPNTGAPYFVMQSGGWGTGWVSGNVIRFNTDGCLAGYWIARTVLSGPAEQDDDEFVQQIRGDAD